MTTIETRRVLLDGAAVEVRRDGHLLVAAGGRSVLTEAAIHLPPVTPSKIICIHLNYRSRVEEFMSSLPPAPPTSTSRCRPSPHTGGHVVRPEGCQWLNYEGEIAVVIGATCRNVSPAEAAACIAGYTVANDFGLHDFRDTDAGSTLRVKGFDTLCPLGPGLVRGWDFHHKRIETTVNGATVQDATTDDMVWDMHYLVADLARTITLVPVDVVLSGTLAGSRPVNPGDVVTVSVEGLGSLTNTVVAGPAGVRSDIGAQPSSSEEVVSTALGGDWELRGIRPPRRD